MDSIKAIPIIVLLFVIWTPFSTYNNECYGGERKWFHSEENGYSIAIPDTWIQIPDELIRQASNLMLSKEGELKVLYETGFQPEGSEDWFEYPHIIVQVIKYANFGVHRQLTIDEIVDTLMRFTGKDVSKVTGKYMGREILIFIDNVEIGKVSVDEENLRYFYISEANFSYSVRQKSYVMGYPGRFSLVQLMFISDKESDWHRFENDIGLMFQSFKFDPETAYVVKVLSLDKIMVNIAVYVGLFLFYY